MNAPDNDTLRRLLDARTPGDWRAVRDDSAVDACGGPEVWNVETADGSHVAELYDSDDHPTAAQRVETDATICALAPALAAEVLRLRERTERAEAEAEALASEVLRLRSIVNAARTSLRDYHDSPSGSAHIAWDALCGALGVDGGGR